ncbi:Ribonuclease VapC46 [Rubripirellula obstinata]|uniref:Ribonuclease VapC46 n=1 Tax=Rubripirellula obstinata TaxID=406547 RepID=A0A5B1CA84_9BACT|nr:type II toxin-antitoxin system VapC family toxin [Rubripirellula obstinata]KAA1258038.1 Ribonuclease VapC46 [Rubripirellula obstinata]
MTNAIYWDTSALLKLYAPETDSSDYRRLLISKPEPIAISTLHFVELYYALVAKECRGEIQPGAAKLLFQSFRRHVDERRYMSIEVDAKATAFSCQILDQCMGIANPIPLRSLDGLHLGPMKSAGVTQLVAADLRMKHAAQAVSFAIIDP